MKVVWTVALVQTSGVRLGCPDVGLCLDRSDGAHGTPTIDVVVGTSGSAGTSGIDGTTTVGSGVGDGNGSSSNGAGSCGVAGGEVGAGAGAADRGGGSWPGAGFGASPRGVGVTALSVAGV